MRFTMHRFALATFLLFTAASRIFAEAPPRLPLITGRVIDAAGHPLAGVEVWLRSNRGQKIPSPMMMSGPDGSFSFLGFGLSSDTWYLAACPAGRIQAVHWLTGDLTAPVELRLHAAARITGRVVDPKGSPVPGAHVSAYYAGWAEDVIISYCGGHPRIRHGATDAEGRFDFDQLEPGWFEVRASRALPEVARVQGEAGRTSREIEFVVPAARVSLDVRVLDAAGEPVEGASVHAYDRVAVTDATGAYRFAVPPGKVPIQVRHPTAGWLYEEIEVAADVRHDVRLPPLTQITGRIVGSNGAPVTEPDAAIDYVLSLEVGDDGRFQAAVPQGERRLRIDARGWVVEDRRIIVGDEPLDLEIRLMRPGSLTGRLAGLPPGELGIIHLKDGPEEIPWTPGTDQQGRYEFSWVAPGDWMLVASDVLGRSLERRIHVGEGEKLAAEDFQFPPLPEVRGRVLDAEGLPAAGVLLTFQQGAAEKKVWTALHTFVTGLTAGTWHVQAERQGSGPAFATITVADAPVEVPDLRLGRSVAVTGRVLGLEPGDMQWAVWAEREEGGWKRTASAEQEQRYRISGLGPGIWKVIAKGREGEASALLRILPGDTLVTLDLEMEPAATDPGKDR